MPRIDAAVRSHLGRARGNNEDNFSLNGIFMREDQRNAGGLYKAVSDGKRQLYAVCDGMGGLNKGEEASMHAAISLGALVSAGRRRFAERLQAFIDEVSASLLTLGDGGRPPGSTLALVYFDDKYVKVAHLGDSRVYFKRESMPLTQVTADHSQAEWLLQQGMIGQDAVDVHPSKNVLRRYLGAPVPEGRVPDVSPDTKLKRGDAFLLCSDGLSNMMNNHEIDQEISKGQSCADVCKALTNLALSRNGGDNITVMMLRSC